MDHDAISTAVHAYFDRLQALDMQGWCDSFSEDGITYDPVGNPPTKARDNAEQFFQLLSFAFATIEIAIDHISPVKNAAAAKWTMKVVGKNGRQGQAEGISTFEFDEAGKIRVLSSYWNDAALMSQIRGG